MTANAGSSVTLRTTLQIPQAILTAYENEANAKGVPLESVLSARLLAAASHSSIKPLYLEDPKRKELERLLGVNIRSADHLISIVRSLQSVKVGDVSVPLKPTLLTRLKTRCFGKPFPDFLAERVSIGLEEYAGMR